MSHPPPAVDPGLCAHCRFGAGQRNARGSVFWRCGRADRDPRFPRYPALPVRTCPGYEATEPPDPVGSR